MTSASDTARPDEADAGRHSRGAEAPGADARAAAAVLTVEVVVDRPGGSERYPLRLTAPASVDDALHAAGLLARDPALAQWPGIGIFGERCGHDRLLRHGDRVEIYRALERDPKQRRRERAARRAASAVSRPGGRTGRGQG